MNETWSCSYSNPVYFDPAHHNTGFAYASSTCSIQASSSAAYVSGFSYGEIVISFFAFMIFLVLAYQFIFNWTRGIKIGKKGV
jgi:hypothetical protein